MKINVAQQLKEPVGTVRYLRIDEATPEGFPIRGEIKLLRTNRSILATGTLHTRVKSVCSRCLEEFEQKLTLQIEEEYFPTREVMSGAPLGVPRDSGALTIDENHILDLSEAVRQHILLARPMKPICREDCAGLCPNCGQNLNFGICRCAPDERPFSPWAQLRSLVEGEKGEQERE
jgi:uncharacterized protein